MTYLLRPPLLDSPMLIYRCNQRRSFLYPFWFAAIRGVNPISSINGNALPVHNVSRWGKLRIGPTPSLLEQEPPKPHTSTGFAGTCRPSKNHLHFPFSQETHSPTATSRTPTTHRQPSKNSIPVVAYRPKYSVTRSSPRRNASRRRLSRKEARLYYHRDGASISSQRRGYRRVYV